MFKLCFNSFWNQRRLVPYSLCFARCKVINTDPTLQITSLNRGMSDRVDEPQNKKTKFENNGKTETGQDGINDLSKFVVVRVLSDYGQRKTTCIEGKFTDRDGKAVVWMEKTPFSETVIKSLCTDNSKLKKEFVNDIYGSYSCLADPSLNEIKTTIIYPATEQHIKKFEQKPSYLIEETPEYYNTITLPFLEKEQFDIQWVYNVLEGKKEQERVVFEDKDQDIGFVLLPDLKWNGKQNEDLYLLALVQPHGIKSLRDLTPKHLPLLRNILTKGTKAIYDLYGIPRSNLRIYIHYQPTFYHLHIHFTYLKFEASGIFCEKSHILPSIINNIELLGDYYQKATLPFVVSEGQHLCFEYINRGIIQQLPVKQII